MEIGAKAITFKNVEINRSIKQINRCTQAIENLRYKLVKYMGYGKIDRALQHFD